jgi:hypothetical protein
VILELEVLEVPSLRLHDVLRETYWHRHELGCPIVARQISSELASSASLAIPTAIPFTLFAQLIFVEARRTQFAANVASHRSLAGFPVSAAVSFALFPQPVLVFTGSSQFLALAATTTAVVYSDSARTDLNGLGKGRRWKCKKGRRDHEYKSAHH